MTTDHMILSRGHWSSLPPAYLNVISVIEKHKIDFSTTTRMVDPTLKTLELIRQSNSKNWLTGIQGPLTGKSQSQDPRLDSDQGSLDSH